MNKNKKILFGILIALIAGVIIGVLTIKSPGDKGKAGLMGETINTVKEITKKQLSAQKPSDVVLNYFKALREKDYSKAAGYLSEEGKKRIEGSGISVEKAMESEAEENEKAGYTKVEIIRESALQSSVLIPVRCSSYSFGCDRSNYIPGFLVNMVKEGNKWKTLEEMGAWLLPSLPGKIEIHPLPGSAEWAALEYFKAILNGDYSEAKKYMILDDRFFWERSSKIIYYCSDDLESSDVFSTREKFDKWYKGLDEELKEKIINKILEKGHDSLERDEIQKIKGVILESTYIEGKLKMCAENAYCDKFDFFIEKEKNAWKIREITPG